MLKTLRPSLRALLIHLIALTLVLGYRFWLTDQNQAIPILFLACAEGLIATALGLLSKLRAWWIPINLLFFPLLYLASSYAISPLWTLSLFIIIWLLNWNAFSEQVPLYLSGNKTIEALAKHLEKKHAFTFADFGCGLASVLIKLAKHFPQAHFTGYETAPLPYLIAKIRSIGISNLDIKRQSFWKTQWNTYDIVYCFLSPAPMPKIESYAKNNMKSDAILISNTFLLPKKEAMQIININDLRATKLYIYRYK
ncbi:MAG: class I SAM-dependent methyltransferase [Gammaproteobacteria bacterium]|nr:class I SAM-dependent methyltransferase [Gammaproteobacteria bacterium]